MSGLGGHSADAWRDAVLDALANTCQDAAIGTSPTEIMRRVIEFHVSIPCADALELLREARALMESHSIDAVMLGKDGTLSERIDALLPASALTP